MELILYILNIPLSSSHYTDNMNGVEEICISRKDRKREEGGTIEYWGIL